MANAYARNLQDASLNPAVFALPTTIALSKATYSPVVDLGADTVKPESIEIELSVPALSDTIAPAASTAGVFFFVQSSTTAVFTAVARTLVQANLVGAGTGVAAQSVRCRLPSDCERYIRGGVYLGTTATDASALSATLSLRF